MPGPHRLSLKQRLEILEQINALKTTQGSRISELRLFGEYGVWQFFQQYLLYEGLASLGRRPQPPSFFKRLVLASSKLGLVFVSFLGLFYLWLSRRRVLIYTIDRLSSEDGECDFRMKKIYDFLRSQKLSYFEVVHTNPGPAWIGKFLRRRRPVIYLEAVDWVLEMAGFFLGSGAVQVDTSSLPQEYRNEIGPLVSRCLRKASYAEAKTRLLRWVLAPSAVRTLLTIDDTRYYHELVLACQNEGIASFAFQHGHFTKYHVGWLRAGESTAAPVLPDYLVVWSEYWKNELLRLGSVFPASQLLVGGRPFAGAEAIRQSTGREGWTTILVPFETIAPKTAVTRAIRELKKIPRLEILFKTRPDVSAEKQLAEYGLLPGEVTSVSDLSDSPRIDLAVGTYSTFLYEMVEQKVPVALLVTELDLGEGLVRNELATILRPEALTESDLRACIHQASQNLDQKKEKLEGKTPPDFDRFLKRLIDNLELREHETATASS